MSNTTNTAEKRILTADEIGNKKRDRKYLWQEIKRNKSCYFMLAPFLILFIVFTVIPVVMSLPMGFTDFDMVHFPKWVGIENFYTLFIEDDVFMTAVRVTLVFAVFTGPLSYALCFFLAWLINELPGILKTIFTLIFYIPSMSNVYYIWQTIFSGDSYGWLNAVLINLGIITGPKQWLTDSTYILGCVIVVQLWLSLGAGFLAFRAGFQGIDKSMYEAGAIEGIKNRWQELIFITLPSMGPQLMFSAVMTIVSAFTAGTVSQNLVGLPSTDYAAHTLMNHAQDYGWTRYEMGYSSAICMVLFVTMLVANYLIRKVLDKYID